MALTIVQPAVGGTGVGTFPSPGTTNNVLTSNGTVWTSATPKIINVERVQNSTRASITSLSGSAVGTLVTFTYNKQAASTSLIFIVMVALNSNSNGTMAIDLTYGTSSAFGSLNYTYTAEGFPMPLQGQATLTGYTTTGSQTLTVRYYTADSSGGRPGAIINPNSTDDARNIQQVSTVTVIEYS